MRRILPVLAVLAAGGLMTACGGGSAPTPAAAGAAASKAVHHKAPKPVDPDAAMTVALRDDATLMTRLHGLGTDITAFGDSTGTGDLDLGASTASTVSHDFNWLTNRIQSKPGSSDSDLAQQTMVTYRLCRDTYSDTAEALMNRDLAGITNAKSALDTCTRGIEQSRSLIPNGSQG